MPCEKHLSRIDADERSAAVGLEQTLTQDLLQEPLVAPGCAREPAIGAVGGAALCEGSRARAAAAQLRR